MLGIGRAVQGINVQSEISIGRWLTAFCTSTCQGLARVVPLSVRWRERWSRTRILFCVLTVSALRYGYMLQDGGCDKATGEYATVAMIHCACLPSDILGLAESAGRALCAGESGAVFQLG